MYLVTATIVTEDLSKLVIYLTNLFASPGIRTKTWPPTGWRMMLGVVLYILLKTRIRKLN